MSSLDKLSSGFHAAGANGRLHHAAQLTVCAVHVGIMDSTIRQGECRP